MNGYRIFLGGTILLFFFFIVPSHGQDELPRILPTNIKPLKGENDPTNYCYINIIVDTTGRLWMKTCGSAAQLYDLRIFQFDGYDLWPLNVSKEKWDNYRIGYLEGVSAKGYLYGYLNEFDKGSVLYTYDVATNTIKYTPVSGLITGGIEEYAPGKFWVFTKSKTAFSFHKWDGKDLEFYLSIPNENHYRKEVKRYIREIDANFEYVDNTLWVLDKNLPLIAIDIPTKTVTNYSITAFPDYTERTLSNEEIYDARVHMVIRGDEVFVAHTMIGDQFYTMNSKAQKQRFETLPLLPKGAKALSIWKDEQDNLLFIFHKGKMLWDGNLGAYLLDASGQLFDYSSMVKGMRDIHHVSGNDFKQQAFLGTSNGAFLVESRKKISITAYNEIRVVRHIRQIGEDEFLIRCQGCGRFILKGRQVSEISSTSCLREERNFSGRKALLTDPLGEIWLQDEQHLHRYNPDADGSCITHHFDFKVRIASFITDQKVALIDQDNQLIIYDLKKQQRNTISTEPIVFTGIIHEVYVGQNENENENENGDRNENENKKGDRNENGDGNENLWVATNKGIYKVDLTTGETQKYGNTDDFEDSRILSIHDDQKGRLWLGTASRGLHVFNIEKEEVELIINEAGGLSNNIIVGILEDDDGVIWAATYNGLNLIRPNGEIIAILNEKDGLSHYEFNRYAHFKAKDGRLFFGTVRAMNVIDPNQIKQTLETIKAAKIYVSRLSYFDSKEDRVVHIRNYSPGEKRLTLSADKRFLSISVGMSNYGGNAKKRYAYKLEGVDKDWTYIGAEHFIRLPSLPTGKYNFLIVGIDANGNRSSNTIRIPIHAKEFFYKQAWFYMLLALPFLVFAFLWIRRLSKEKEMLEKEVDKRTFQIRKDKELIEQQASELKQLDKMKSRFFANISHDFRTPLTLITGPAELVEQDELIPKSPKLKQSLQSILQNGKKLLSLVDEMLDLAKIESHKIKLHEEKVNLQSFCEAIYMSYQAAAQRKHIQFQLNYHLVPGYYLLTDPRRLEKILNNLLSNAFKFTENSGEVIFNIYRKQNEVFFELKDTGRGIPKEDLPNIFERYFQSKQEALLKTTGSGIGLSLSLELAKLMGGDILVKSVFREGSTFTLKLPAKGESTGHAKVVSTEIEAFQQDSYVLSSTPFRDKNLFGKKSAKILIVEDNLEVQAFLRALLEERYEVVTKDNGLEALHFLKEHKKTPVELILSDINMPEMDGYELLGAIKQDEGLQQLPVIMLTAKVKEKSKLKALRMGVDDYLTKPFSPTELIVRIQNLLNNYKQRLDYRKAYFEIAPQFEETASADQSWLEELENKTLGALDKQIDLNVPYLSDAMAISQRQLARKVKLLTGLTIGKYIQEIKLQKARHLLENRIVQGVAEAAYQSGFKSPSHFNKIYFQYYGKNPSAYL